MQNPFPVRHSPHVCNKKWNIPILCYCHMQLTWLHWSRSWSRSFWSRSHNRFLVSVSVAHSLVPVLALVSICSAGLINNLTSLLYCTVWSNCQNKIIQFGKSKLHDLICHCRYVRLDYNIAYSLHYCYNSAITQRTNCFPLTGSASVTLTNCLDIQCTWTVPI